MNWNYKEKNILIGNSSCALCRETVQQSFHCWRFHFSTFLLFMYIGKSFRSHLHVSGYPCKRILLKTFTQTIYTKRRKRIANVDTS